MTPSFYNLNYTGPAGTHQFRIWLLLLRFVTHHLFSNLIAQVTWDSRKLVMCILSLKLSLSSINPRFTILFSFYFLDSSR